MAAAAAVGTALAVYGLTAGGLFGAVQTAEDRREADAIQVEHIAFTGDLAVREEKVLRVAKGESLALLLSRAGADWSEVNRAVTAVSPVFNPRRVRPGQEVSVYLKRAEGKLTLSGFSFRSDPGAAVTVSRVYSGEFIAREILTPVTFEVARVRGKVTSSLYEDAVAGGATDKEVGVLSDIFAYDVDFQRDIFPGDTFELVFERFYDDEGRTVRTGELLYAALAARDGPKAFYRFTAPGETQGEWYDADGKTARKFLMKTPINGARLSSGYGMRRHPILGFTRMHQGTDFAAPTGTPIMAAGDGVIDRIGYFGGYGRYIRIRHDNQYQTAYGHMSAFASGLRVGAKVRQGSTIGYVGSTGSSTGPHLHYEVLVNGVHINPMGMRLPTGRNLEGEALAAFMAERDRIDLLRQAREEQAQVVAANYTPGQQSLRGGLQ
jgi:murein DD-endopeptidase MepM/ murein hydrolase activator NlpD